MTKDVKSYNENYWKINFKVIGCQRCNSSNVVCNGFSFRKKAQVFLQRLLCKDCGVCLVWLPPFLLPHKHYPIHDILPAVKRYLMGSTGYVKALEDEYLSLYDLSTFLRWMKTLGSMAKELHKIARKTLASLKPNWNPEKDKRIFSACFPTANNQNLNLLYKIFILQEYFVFESVAPEDFFVWLIFASRNRKLGISPP